MLQIRAEEKISTLGEGRGGGGKEKPVFVCTPAK